MDLGIVDADWEFLSGELHLIVVRCDSRSFTQSVTYFETDVASGSSAAIVSACLFVFRHLWLILVELLRQSPALLLQSVHRCESTREHQKWRLQHEAADYTSRQPHTTDFNVLLRLNISTNPFDCGHRIDLSPGLRLRLTHDFFVDCRTEASGREWRFDRMRDEWSSGGGTNRERDEALQKQNRFVSMFRTPFVVNSNTEMLKSHSNLNHQKFQVLKSRTQTPVSTAIHLRLSLF